MVGSSSVNDSKGRTVILDLDNCEAKNSKSEIIHLIVLNVRIMDLIKA